MYWAGNCVKKIAFVYHRFLLHTLPSPSHSDLHQQALHWLNQPRVQFETRLELPHQQQQITGDETLLKGLLPCSWYLCEAKGCYSIGVFSSDTVLYYINWMNPCKFCHCSWASVSFEIFFVCALSVSASSIGEVPEWLCHCSPVEHSVQHQHHKDWQRQGLSVSRSTWCYVQLWCGHRQVHILTHTYLWSGTKVISSARCFKFLRQMASPNHKTTQTSGTQETTIQAHTFGVCVDYTHMVWSS